MCYYEVFVIRKYCVVHNTDKSECGRHHPQKGSIFEQFMCRFSGQKPHERARNINPYLDEVRGWVRSFRPADAGRPRTQPGVLVD